MRKEVPVEDRAWWIKIVTWFSFRVDLQYRNNNVGVGFMYYDPRILVPVLFLAYVNRITKNYIFNRKIEVLLKVRG